MDIGDDLMSARHSLKDCLAGRDIPIIEAQNGQEAVEIFAAEKPDLVFYDSVLRDLTRSLK